MYSFTKDKVKKFIGQAVQRIVCNDLNTNPSEKLLKETFRVSSKCISTSKSFLSVSNQDTSIRRKNAKEAYFEELGYLMLTKKSGVDVHYRHDSKRSKQVEEAD